MHAHPRSATMRIIGAAGALALGAFALTGCSAGGDDGGKTVITLAGPNQWNNESDSFGQAWEDLVARFEEAEPDIEVRTTVLPISSFSDTLSTQLSAGTAPELVFAQAPHTPDQVVALDDYLDEPNPYIEGNTKWIDAFNSTAYNDAQRNAEGDFEFIPFNLVIAGVFYNTDALEKAGVTAPIEDISDLINACSALKDAGYTPLAMDNGSLGSGWTSETILSNLLSKYASEWNVYDVDGDEGTAPSVTQKSLARAVLTGELDATKTPEVAEAAELLQKVYTDCATPNWSGVASSATFVGSQEFLAGTAAMAWGTNFAASNLDDVSWGWSSMPFPSVSTADTPLASGDGAQFGAVAGGTSYMIPATTTGAKLDAAVKFLQFVTSTEGGQDWIDATGAIPSTVGAEAAPGLEDLMTGSWAEPRTLTTSDMIPKAQTGTSLWDGYLLGSKTLDEQLTSLETVWTDWAHEAVESYGWTEDWATS
jgi:ABC-type glycerol-3-phosphate transport system substrate-binding protein